MSEKQIMYVFEWKFTYKPFENRQSFEDGAGKPLRTSFTTLKKIKRIFFIFKDIEKSINLELDKYGDFHHFYSGSSP